jgi:hypothetical protein
MPSPGDYENEMGLLSAEQVEAVLSGRPPQDSVGVRAGVAVAEVRLALTEEPPPALAARHLAAMFEAAATARSVVKSRRSPSLPARSRRVAAMVLAATLVLGVGIGAALTLPGGLPQTAERARRASAQEVHEAGGNHGGTGAGVVPNTGATPVRGDQVVSERGAVISDTARRVAPAGCVRGQTLAGLPQAPVADAPVVAARRDPCTASTTVPQEEVAPASPGAPDLGAVGDHIPGGTTDGQIPGRQGSGGGAGQQPGEGPAEKPGAGEGGSVPGGPGSRTGPAKTPPTIDLEGLLPI